MMKPLASMEDLPNELLEMISQHWSVRDLSNCCAVSKRWRERFNMDLLWKRYCDPTLAHYLNITPRQVNPGNPESENSSLCPLSYWRLSYMRETQVWNNWRSGNYKATNLPSSPHGYSELSDKILFFRDDFVLSAHEGYLYVYEFDDKDELSCVFSAEFPIYSSYAKLLASDDNLLLVKNYKVSVFKLHVSPFSKFLKLTYVFYIGQEDVIRNGNHHLSYFIMENKFILDGAIVLAVCKTEAGEKICIWNIETNLLVKEECLSEDNITYQRIYIYHIDKKSKNLLVGYSTKGHQDDRHQNPDSEKVFFRVYNLTKRAFLPFSMSTIRNGNMGYLTSSTCAIYDNFCAFIFGNKMSIYNWATNNLVYSINLQETIFSKLTCFQKGFLFNAPGRVLCLLEVLPIIEEKHYNYNCELDLQNTRFLESPCFVACNRILFEYQQETRRTKKPVVSVSRLLDVSRPEIINPRKGKVLLTRRTDGSVDKRVTNKKLDVKRSLTLYNLDGYKPLVCNSMGTRLILSNQANNQLVVLNFW